MYICFDIVSNSLIYLAKWIIFHTRKIGKTFKRITAEKSSSVSAQTNHTSQIKHFKEKYILQISFWFYVVH